MEIKIKKLNKKAIIPSYAKDGDAGLDLTCVSKEYSLSIDCEIYHTGIAVEIPNGYVGLVFPRSSNRNKAVYLPNSVGVIDSGYRGEILVSFKRRDCVDDFTIEERLKLFSYDVGDRIAQLIIIPYPEINFIEVEELSDSERGIGGHGSTGN